MVYDQHKYCINDCYNCVVCQGHKETCKSALEELLNEGL